MNLTPVVHLLSISDGHDWVIATTHCRPQFKNRVTEIPVNKRRWANVGTKLAHGSTPRVC